MQRYLPACAHAALTASLLAWALSAAGLTAHAQDRSTPATGKQAEKEEARQDRKRELDEMRRRAEGTTVLRLGGADKAPAKLVAEPLMRYSDQIILVTDATLWAYGAKGRPLAVQKVECYRHPSFPKYLYALFSLSDGLIEARWPGESGWSSTKPGIEMRVLPDAPQPAATGSGRLVQMKQSIRRFAATMTGWQNRKDEMRLLARPLYRYADAGSGIQDGAIFALVVYGTNPSCLILIELHGADVAHASWKYGLVRMTDGGLSVRLDGKEAWSADWRVSASGRYDTWLYFYARQQARGQQ